VQGPSNRPLNAAIVSVMPSHINRETIEVPFKDMSVFLTEAEKGASSLLRAIYKAGVDINAADPYGRTILMHLVMYAPRVTAKLRRRIFAGIACLLANQADPNLADENGLTPFDVALKLQHKDIIEILFTHRAKFSSSIHHATS
jgi:ankyrin repeat protein